MGRPILPVETKSPTAIDVSTLPNHEITFSIKQFESMYQLRSGVFMWDDMSRRGVDPSDEITWQVYLAERRRRRLAGDKEI